MKILTKKIFYLLLFFLVFSTGFPAFGLSEQKSAKIIYDSPNDLLCSSVLKSEPDVSVKSEITIEINKVALAYRDEEPIVIRAYPELKIETDTTINGKGTGFFHTQKIGDKWWVIAPNGKGFIAVGAQRMTYKGHYSEALGYSPY
ncbi:MAG: hypothetical protein FNP40_03870, partial [Dehalobacter sp. 4CP]|nr:hypothetical protein [Dehalobacter sp. 4CP]